MELFVQQMTWFGFLQSLFLLGVFLISPRTRSTSNGFIILLITVLSMGLLGRILHQADFFGKSFRFLLISEFASLLFCPTIFLFVKSSLHQEKFRRKHLIHYLPALVYDILLVRLFYIPSEFMSKVFQQPKALLGIILVMLFAGLLFNSIYWFKSWQSFQRFQKNLENELSYTVKTQFFRNLLIAVAFCLCMWFLIFLVTLLRMERLPRVYYFSIWLSLSFLILFIAYYVIREPELFRVPTLISNPKKYQQSKLIQTDLDKLKARLEQIMIDKKPYLNRKLLKAELAELLGISNPELARLLNERIGMNFFEYVNYFRIKEFIQLAQSERAQRLTFFALAQEAGFNSKTTFNKSFKQITGKTPKEYFSEG